MKLDPTAVGALVDSVSQGNPMIKSVTEMLVQALGDDSDETEEKARQERRRRAQLRLRRIHRMMQHSSQRNAFIAGALGACECWGEDSSCRTCRGRGVPGFYEPDVEAFTALVVPLFESRRAFVDKQLQARESKAREDV